MILTPEQIEALTNNELHVLLADLQLELQYRKDAIDDKAHSDNSLIHQENHF